MPDTEPHHDNPFDTDLQVLHSKDFFARMKSTVKPVTPMKRRGRCPPSGGPGSGPPGAYRGGSDGRPPGQCGTHAFWCGSYPF